MTTPIKLKLNSSNELKLSLKSYGDIDTITEVSLVIEGDMYDYKFTGKMVDGVVHVKVPRLQGVVESGSYNAKVNVIADGDKYFQPYSGTVMFPELGKVDMTEAKLEDAQSDIKIEVIQEEDEVEEKSSVSNSTKYSKFFEDD
ncbi:hypothetical protein GD1_109 [Paraglaciecola Antarctic GD virus 1]|nr:hypothetical protein GD1_109 [Paraglaciecola Antarctic GD virus 1]